MFKTPKQHCDSKQNTMICIP